MISKYRKDSIAKSDVTQAEVNEIKALLFSTIEKTKTDYSNGVFENYTPYTVSTTGNTLNNIEQNISIYPNPTNGIVNISLDNSITKADIAVYNAAGTIIANTTAQRPQLNLSEAAAGIYFVKITTDKGNFIQKIVLEN